jgi:cyanophycin synthetase
MQLVQTKTFQGPNRWSRNPVLEAVLDLGSTEGRSAAEISTAIDRLHQVAGVSGRAFPPEATEHEGRYVLAFEVEETGLLEECIRTAIQLCQEIPANGQLNFSAHQRRLEDLADDIRLGPSSQAILRAAKVRDIPYFRMNQGSLVQFGEGAWQRRTWTAETDATSAIAEAIASDKQLTRSLLAAVGVNVPGGRSVSSREDAWQAALEVGLPVAVKPRNANHAVGVSLDLMDQSSVMSAYDWACQAGHTTEVLVEQYIHGEHHRLLVVGGKFVAAAKGQREFVQGDGCSTILQLVDRLNSDPRRGENYTDQLQIVKLDDAAAILLKNQGLDFDSVPDQNQQVLINHVGDLVEDCTEQVHSSTREMAILAARVVGLDIAGMDVVAIDIAKPLTEQRGCIIEVNAGPSLTPHVAPVIGSPRPVGQSVVELLFPDQRPSRVPTVVCVSSSNNHTIARQQAKLLTSLQFHVGYAAPDVTVHDGLPVERPLSQFRSLLMHPHITANVLNAPVQWLAQFGLPCSHAELVLLDAALMPSAAHSTETRFALQTLVNLLQTSGTLAIVGSIESAMPWQSSCLSELPSDRVVVLTDWDQVEPLLRYLVISFQG